MIEIERKFLVKDLNLIPFDKAWEKYEAVQGYLMYGANNKILRVGKYVNLQRAHGSLMAPHGTLCLKIGKTAMSRIEIENRIPFEEANELLKYCEGHLIEKDRYWFKTMTEDEEDPIWEVDIFRGVNQGLVIAEIELPSEDYKIELPDFIGKEVTNDPRYHNSYLAKMPFSTWE